METFPKKISAAVFVTAVMPGPTLNISTLIKEVCPFAVLDWHRLSYMTGYVLVETAWNSLT